MKSAPWIATTLVLACLAQLASRGANARERQLCADLRLEGALEPGLSDTELRLVCGDPKSQAWRSIPPPQATFHLRTFLQNRGYHRPEFIATEGGGTRVRIGTPTRLTRVQAEGAPAALRLERRRGLRGKPLTPALLSSIEQWVVQRLQALGHPCPLATALGNSDTGDVVVQVRTGPAPRVGAVIEEELVPGLLPGLFRRYDAFQLGESFNGDWLAVTADRINAQDVIQNIHFTPVCEPLPDERTGVVIRQSLTPGPPRLLSFGLGIDTEGLLLARAAWRHARLGRAASWLNVTALASAREQSLESTLNWYPLAVPSRRSLRPSLLLRHQNEEPFETFEARGSFALSTTYDDPVLGMSLLFGPSLRAFRTFRGVGPRDSHFLFLDTEVGVMSHSFEYFAANPRTGYRLGALASVGTRSLFSTLSAQRAEFTAQGLWNFRDFDPPLLVIGFRGALAATFTSERPGPSTGLPANFFHYLGGSSNLRGFGRQELPRSHLGGLTSAFFSTEARLGSTLPWNLEPLVFLDVGALGQEPLTLTAPIYHSPGFGLRWLSPVGVFRTTLAHGYPSNVPGHWQFFLSFAEEF
ncbi:MAG: BamA/TamA family outer membrane protein [Oligoflexia bacterium]|nr:BamA/TamA family outer membrane protein [Oligoflexia bacterium]